MTTDVWIEIVRKSGLLDAEALAKWTSPCMNGLEAGIVAKSMVEAGVLSNWHIDLLLKGKWKGFFVDSYCLWDLMESDDSRGIHIYSAIDRRTGSSVVMELVPPKRARTKADRIFYIVHRKTLTKRFKDWIMRRCSRDQRVSMPPSLPTSTPLHSDGPSHCEKSNRS